MLSTHISSGFDADLKKVFDAVLAMGGLIEEQLGAALGLLLNPDPTVVSRVLEGERQINALEVSLDQQCLAFIACRHPAAGDLRLILVLIKVINDLERIADEAEKVAKLSGGLDLERTQGIISMGALVEGMTHDVLAALSSLDTDAAFTIAAREPESNRLRNRMQKQFAAEEDTLDYIWVIRALERIADHVRNICEYIVYCTEGKDVRHTDIEHIQR